MKSLLVILIGLFTSWRYTDLSSDSSLCSVLAPLGVFVFLVSLGAWLVLKAGFGGRTDGGAGSHGGEGGFGGDGGFGGGGGCD